MDIAFSNRMAHVIAWNEERAANAENLRDRLRYEDNARRLTKLFFRD